jgi:hypothetical protein
MGAEDVASAVDRALRLDLKGPAERDIVRVALDCVGQEASYNPFFALVLGHLSGLQPRFRFTAQLALWDAFKGFDDTATYTARRVYNLGRFAADLLQPPVGGHGGSSRGKDAGGPVLNLGVLKPLPFSSAERGSSPRSLLFLKTVLSASLLEARGPNAVAAIFGKTGRGADKMLVRDGVLAALHSHVSLATLAAAAPAHGAAIATLERGDLKERLRAATRALEGITIGGGREDVDDL